MTFARQACTTGHFAQSRKAGTEKIVNQYENTNRKLGAKYRRASALE